MSKSVTRKVLQRGKDNVIEVVGFFINITKLLFVFFYAILLKVGALTKVFS